MENHMLEEYLTSIKQDFNHLDERLDKDFQAIDQRFEAIDQRFEAVDNRFDRLEERLDSQDNWLEEIARNMAKVLHLVVDQGIVIKQINDKLFNHERRITALERQAA